MSKRTDQPRFELQQEVLEKEFPLTLNASIKLIPVNAMARGKGILSEKLSRNECESFVLKTLTFVKETQNTKSPVKRVVFSKDFRMCRSMEPMTLLKELLWTGVTIHFSRGDVTFSSLFSRL